MVDFYVRIISTHARHGMLSRNVITHMSAASYHGMLTDIANFMAKFQLSSDLSGLKKALKTYCRKLSYSYWAG